MQALIEGDAVLLQRLVGAGQPDPGRARASSARAAQTRSCFRRRCSFASNCSFRTATGSTSCGRCIRPAAATPGVDDVFHESARLDRADPAPGEVPHARKADRGAAARLVGGELGAGLAEDQLERARRARFAADPGAAHRSRARGARRRAGWGGDRWQLLEKDGQQALVIKSVWDTENDARNFFETFGLAMQQSLRRGGEGGGSVDARARR